MHLSVISAYTSSNLHLIIVIGNPFNGDSFSNDIKKYTKVINVS